MKPAAAAQAAADTHAVAGSSGPASRTRLDIYFLEITLYFMGRPPRYSTDRLLAEAVALAAEGGAAAVTMQGVARAVGAPSGSLYHRFAARPHLLAEVWRAALATFLDDWWRRVHDEANPGRAAAATVRWARTHRSLARVLLLRSAEDFVGSDAPGETRDAVRALRQRSLDHLATLAARYLGRADPEAMERASFALAQVPVAALRRPLRTGAPIGRRAERLVAEAARALLNGDSHDRHDR